MMEAGFLTSYRLQRLNNRLRAVASQLDQLASAEK